MIRFRRQSGNHPAVTLLLQPASRVARAALAIVTGERVVAMPAGPDPDAVIDAADVLAVLARHSVRQRQYVQWWVPSAAVRSDRSQLVGARLREWGLCTYFGGRDLRVGLQRRGEDVLPIEFLTDEPPDYSVQVHAELAVFEAHFRPDLLALGLGGVARQVLALTDEAGPWPWLDRITRASPPHWAPPSIELALAGAE